jgi:hypothetical protein
MTTTDADFDPYDFIDDDWIEAVVSVSATLPGRELDNDHTVRTTASARRTRLGKSVSKIVALANRLRRKR